MDRKVIISEQNNNGMLIRYYLNKRTNNVSLMIIPTDYLGTLSETKVYADDSLVHLKITGDNYPGWFSQGRTMRNAKSTDNLNFVDQTFRNTSDGVLTITRLKTTRGLKIFHYLQTFKHYDGIEVFVECINETEYRVGLEMISTFSLGGLTPFEDGISKENLYLHRFRSSWTKEGLHERIKLEELQLEPSATGASANCLRFGSIGSMPVREFFPVLAVEDERRNCFWAANLSLPSSWQLEVYRRDEALSISGGLADREFGHWLKYLEPQEHFKTPSAFLTVGTGNIENVMERLTKMQKRFRKNRADQQTLPILFNEFCTTWGKPTLTSIEETAKHLKGRGIEYYIIDGGWSKNVGDWEVRQDLFPGGIAKAVKVIKESGLRPGIWFEFENCDRNSTLFFEHKEWLLKRDGYPIVAGERAFLDMGNEEVQAMLRKSVIQFLITNGFDYLKIDYNETIGIGCEGTESLGEGLRRNMLSAQEFIREIKETIPDLEIEICASGGHRLENSMIALGSMASCSDAHESVENPIIAAQVQYLVLPEISQIWVVLRRKFSSSRTLYALSAGFLGRFCLSGDIQNLLNWQNDLLDKAVKTL